ncbi:uroporphyrinogen-III synthase [Arenimonas sp.]|uniref:uroporphyrinogen-III synthase n=1 Tax=Arenimonas sp. TaxID=1872635 RepID=UPI0039E5BFE4
MSRALPAHSPAWYVISLRPLGQHAGVRRAAARRGANCFAMTTLQLQALPARTALAKALSSPWVIATSPAAARFAAAQANLRRRRGQTWFALGRGTAAALERAGVDAVRTPRRGATSEDLLAELPLAAMQGHRVGLITAPGGRGEIAAALSRQRMGIALAEVYRRVVRPIPASRLAALFDLPPRSVLLVSSAEAFDALWQGCNAPQRERLRRFRCVASSERLRAHLSDRGLRNCVLADDTSAAAMVAAAEAHLGGRIR